MPKHTFTFKQFIIHQEKTAMKVCTDACIFGASIDLKGYHSILDIGTGTGLLALMLAQRSAATIDAVEIEQNAYEQACFNIENSPFESQISVFHQSIQNFETDKKYDLIISNPPFYQNSLKSSDTKTNKALHNESLNFEELVEAVCRLIDVQGIFYVLLPPFEFEKLMQIAEKKELYLSKKVIIKHSENKPILRVIAAFSFEKPIEISKEILIIHEQDNKTYTSAFKELLKDYYLIF